MLNSTGISHLPPASTAHNQSERSGSPGSQAATSVGSLGPRTAQQLESVEVGFRQCVWSFRNKLDNLHLTEVVQT